MTWDNTKIDKLKHLVERSVTAKDIAIELGVTKNSIIGKCNRLGLKLPDTHNRYRRKLKPKFKRKKRLYLKPVSVPSTKKSSIKVKTRKFLKLRNKMSIRDKELGMNDFYKRIGIPPIPDSSVCHYIHGNDIKNGNYTWCNRPVHKTNGNKISVYCEYHHKRMYVTSYKSKPQNYIAPRNRYIT